MAALITSLFHREQPIVSLDAIRRKHKIDPTDKSGNGWVVQTAKEEARIYLRKGQNFIWNATHHISNAFAISRSICFLWSKGINCLYRKTLRYLASKVQ